MRVRFWGGVWSVFLVGFNVPVGAVELAECVTFAVNANGEASLANGCGDRLNLTYCIDNPKSTRDCSSAPLGVTMLPPGGVELIPSYTDDGAGMVYWAVCVYPEAAVDWKPGPDSEYSCRKTCVMC